MVEPINPFKNLRNIFLDLPFLAILSILFQFLHKVQLVQMTASKHYINKRVVVKQMNENGFRIFPEKNKVTPDIKKRAALL